MAWTDKARRAAVEARRRKRAGIGYTPLQKAYGMHKMSKEFERALAGALVGVPIPKKFLGGRRK